MVCAILILSEKKTEDIPQNEWVVEARDKEDAREWAQKRIDLHWIEWDAKIKRIRRMTKAEYNEYLYNRAGYMNGGYLKYRNRRKS